MDRFKQGPVSYDGTQITLSGRSYGTDPVHIDQMSH